MASKHFSLEFAVGIFVLVGLAAVAYVSVYLGDLSESGDDYYSVKARFTDSSGLKEGAFIEVAGVRVGKVSGIVLDPKSYESVVTLTLEKTVQLQEDSVASIRTAGIIGDKFVKVAPGGSDVLLKEGDEIFETEPSISIEELVSKYIFNN